MDQTVALDRATAQRRADQLIDEWAEGLVGMQGGLCARPLGRHLEDWPGPA